MKTINLSKGNPAKTLILFAIPMILSVTLQQIYNIADSAIGGKFIGSDALAAVSAPYSITMIYLAFATGLGVGAGIITSRYFSSGDNKKTKTSIYTALIFTVLLSIVMTVLGLLITPATLRLVDTPDNIFHDSSVYLRFYCGGLLFTYLYNVITYIFQSLGDSKTPLYFLIFSTILNIILDLVFVWPMDLGVMGLALGTFVAQGVAMIASFIFLVVNLKKILPTEGKVSLFDFKMLKDILYVAIPTILQGSTIAVGNFFIQKKINSYGSDLIAGYGAAYKLCYVVVNIFTAYSNAISTYTAQNIGAGKHKRIIAGFKWSLVICIIFALVMTALMMLLPKQLLSLFMDSDASANAMTYGKAFCFIVSPFFILMGIKIPSDGVIKGSKDMIGFTISTLVDLALRIAFSYILSSIFGYKGIFFAWPIGWAAGALISFGIFVSGIWKKKALFPPKEEYDKEEI